MKEDRRFAFRSADHSVKHHSTRAKVLLTSSKQSPPQIDTPSQTQPEVDLHLYTKLYSALRMLRTQLFKEAGEGVMAYHIFGNATLEHISKRIPKTKEELLEIDGIGKAKISKYGDRVIETIETTLNEYCNYNVNEHIICSDDESTTYARKTSAANGSSNGNPMDVFDCAVSGDSSKNWVSKDYNTTTAHDAVHYLADDGDDDLDLKDFC